MVNAISYVVCYAHLIYLFSCMVYCLFPNLNEWMYVCLHSHRERSGLRARRIAGEAPEQQAVGEGKCPLTYLSPTHSLIHLLHYTFMPKDWLAFVIHVLAYLFGLDYYCLALCYCSTTINEHDEIIYDMLFSHLLLWRYTCGHQGGSSVFSSASP
jgi:hypothetical protein